MKLKYIGNSEFFADFITHSGKNWNGNGDVQEVTAEQGAKLLNFPDCFEEDTSVVLPTADEINAMNKVSLLTVAADHNIEVNTAAPVVSLRKTIADALYPAPVMPTQEELEAKAAEEKAAADALAEQAAVELAQNGDVKQETPSA